MFKNYVTLAYRNLLKNKLASIINIVGLSVAIGCSMVVFALVEGQAMKDEFHENAASIYLVGHTIEGNRGPESWGSSPVALGAALEADFPAIEEMVRVLSYGGSLRYEQTVFSENFRLVDPAFLDLFTFPLRSGSKAALQDPNSVILSHAIAEKYFGTANPVGQEITITLDNQDPEVYTVGGVAEEFPFGTSFSFSVLMSINKTRDLDYALDDNWSGVARATFIQVRSPQDVAAIERQLGSYLERQQAARPDRPMTGFFFEPLLTLSDKAQVIRGSIAGGENPDAMFMLGVIGAFLLLLACINYTNVAVASATRRIKEIGVRKVMGGQRRQLIVQFLSENLVLCLLALGLGVVLGETVFLPGMMAATGNNLDVTLAVFFNSPTIWFYFVALLLATGIGAGLYPALYISGFAPVSILRGRLKVQGKERFTKTLLTIQFAISFLAVALGVVIWQNNNYQRDRDWGYTYEHVVSVPLDQADQFQPLSDQAQQNPNILDVAGTTHHVGRFASSSIVTLLDEPIRVQRFDVGPGYLETMNIRLRAGRFLDENLTTDQQSALLINQTFADELGWDEPIGQTLTYDNTAYTVVGVLEDFHHSSFFSPIQPSIFRLADADAFNYLVVRTRPGTGVKTADALEASWRALYPNSPYNGFFQDSVFERAFRDNRTIMRLIAGTSTIALLLSCMGLFGLVVLMITKKMRDLSIHKVLGATIWQVAHLINKPFILILILAALLGTPLSYYLLNIVLSTFYEYHVAVGPLPFIIGVLVVLTTATLTIASQIYKAAHANPVDALRAE